MLAAAPTRATPREETQRPYLAPARELSSPRFWWPTVVLERASTHLTGARSVDETRFGLSLAYRTGTLSPHVRALVSPSIDRYQDLALMAGGGLRVHFELAGIPVSYGTGLSLDDFGTGHSSLVRLRQMPFSELKIDRSFVTNLERSGENAVIVRSLVQLAQNLEMHCVIEGVEDAYALKFATQLGCTEAQGFYFAPPMPIDQLLKAEQEYSALARSA